MAVLLVNMHEVNVLVYDESCGCQLIAPPYAAEQFEKFVVETSAGRYMKHTPPPHPELPPFPVHEQLVNEVEVMSSVIVGLYVALSNTYRPPPFLLDALQLTN